MRLCFGENRCHTFLKKSVFSIRNKLRNHILFMLIDVWEGPSFLRSNISNPVFLDRFSVFCVQELRDQSIILLLGLCPSTHSQVTGAWTVQRGRKFRSTFRAKGFDMLAQNSAKMCSVAMKNWTLFTPDGNQRVERLAAPGAYA